VAETSQGKYVLLQSFLLLFSSFFLKKMKRMVAILMQITGSFSIRLVSDLCFGIHAHTHTHISKKRISIYTSFVCCLSCSVSLSLSLSLSPCKQWSFAHSWFFWSSICLSILYRVHKNIYLHYREYVVVHCEFFFLFAGFVSFCSSLSSSSSLPLLFCSLGKKTTKTLRCCL